MVVSMLAASKMNGAISEAIGPALDYIAAKAPQWIASPPPAIRNDGVGRTPPRYARGMHGSAPTRGT